MRVTLCKRPAHYIGAFIDHPATGQNQYRHGAFAGRLQHRAWFVPEQDFTVLQGHVGVMQRHPCPYRVRTSAERVKNWYHRAEFYRIAV